MNSLNDQYHKHETIIGMEPTGYYWLPLALFTYGGMFFGGQSFLIKPILLQVMTAMLLLPLDTNSYLRLKKNHF